MEVALLHWPDEADARESLRQAGRLRILLLAPDSVPPVPADDREDWVRVPVSDTDLRARVEWLEHRVGSAPVATDRHAPMLDEDGVLRTPAGVVSLPPIEARLVQALLDRHGAVVSRDTLARAGWAHRPPDRNALDVQVLRLRRRLVRVGLAVRTVRSRGYLLEWS